MIIACPACATRYVVPDSAIGLEGRTVRCAKCKHSWFQDGPELVEPIAAAYAAPPRPHPPAAAPSPPPPPSEEPARSEPSAAPPSPEWSDAPPAPKDDRHDDAPPAEEEEAPGYEAPVADWQPPAGPDEGDEGGYSQFEHDVPFRPRRNWLRLLTWGAGVFAVLALAAVAALSTLGVPSWLPMDKPLFGTDPGLTVEFPASEQERRTLPNGAEFFGARVVVKNETRETKPVPPLLIVLSDARERVVYSWELMPPQRTLAPGEAMTINEAMTDVPKSAVYADIGWAPR